MPTPAESDAVAAAVERVARHDVRARRRRLLPVAFAEGGRAAGPEFAPVDGVRHGGGGKEEDQQGGLVEVLVHWDMGRWAAWPSAQWRTSVEGVRKWVNEPRFGAREGTRALDGAEDWI